MAVLGGTTVGHASADVPTDERDGRDDRPRLTHEPALDGLRGLAVAAVVLFHLQRLDGGFLGVDLFFVLSGYLITSLLLVEQRRHSAIDLGRFWARRARRLLPALFVLLAGVAVLLLRFTPADQRPRFRGDALATLGYVANWHRMTDDLGYWDIFSQPSPLDHTWSLAIEEQFYLVWPLLVILVLRGRTRNVRVVGWAALAGAAASFAMMAASYSPLDTSRAYFGTDARIGATLLGAAFAAFRILGAENARGGQLLPPERILTAAGLLGLGWMTWSVVTVDGVQSWYYRGGLASFAIASLAVIAAVTRGRRSLLSRVVGLAPLRLLGTISYGVYLWHWPINVYVTGPRTRIDGWQLDELRVVLTLAVAGASFVVIEQPIRRGKPRGRPLRIAAVGATGATLVAVLVATAGTAAPTVDENRGFGPIPLEGSDNPYLLYPADIPAGDLRVLLVGDSGAHNLGPRLAAEGQRVDATVASSAPYYCNVMAPEGVQRLPDGTRMHRSSCHGRRLALWADLVEAFDPDVVVYYLANAGSPSKVLLDGGWVFDCDPAFDRYLTGALQAEADLLGRGDALVVLATSPYSRIPDAGANERIDCRNAVYRDVVASRRGDTAIVELNDFVQNQPDLSQAEMFADMVHLSPAGGQLVSSWLLPELLQLVAENPTTPRPP